MLDKIIVSSDRKTGRVYYQTHSVGFYHSEGKVLELIQEIVIQPILFLERRYECAEEITEVIVQDAQLSLFKDVA